MPSLGHGTMSLGEEERSALAVVRTGLVVRCLVVPRSICLRKDSFSRQRGSAATIPSGAGHARVFMGPRRPP
jgi:hypothetical protein